MIFSSSRPLPARGHWPHDSRLKTGDAPRGPDRAGVGVHHDDRSRPEHRAGVAHRLLVQRQVKLLGAEPG